MSLLDIVHRIFGQRQDSYIITREHNLAMALAYRDKNQIHVDKASAREVPELGLEDTPALGMHLVTLAENRLDDLRHDIGMNGRSGYELAKLAVTIPNPVYPGQQVCFLRQPTDDYVEHDNDIHFAFRGVVIKDHENHIPVIEAEADLTNQQVPLRTLPHIHYSRRESLTQESLNIVNDVTGRKKQEVPHTMVAASLVSALLDLGERAVAIQHGSQHVIRNYGVIRSFAFQPYARPNIGATIESSLYVKRRRPNNGPGPYLYSVEGTVHAVSPESEHEEKKIPLLFGEFRCLSPIDFSKVYEHQHSD